MSLFPQALTQILLEQAVLPSISLFVFGVFFLLIKAVSKTELLKWVALVFILASLITPIFMASRALYFGKKAVEVFSNGPPEMEEISTGGYEKDILLKNGPYTLVLHLSTFKMAQARVNRLKQEENFSDSAKK